MKHTFYILALLFVVNVSFAQNVEVLGNLKIVNGTQGVDKVLTSDSAGNTTWKTPTQVLISQQKYAKGGIQRMLDWGIDPMTLWQNGISADSIYGKTINPGGSISGSSSYPSYIYFIDTLDLYPTWKWLAAIMYPTPFSVSPRVWGCSGTAIPGAQGENFLDGIQNTTDYLAGCNASSTVFSNILPTGFSMASKGDAAMIIQNAVITGTWNIIPFTSNWWTSTEASGADETTKAWAISSTGVLSLQNKTFTSYGLAFKAFNTLQ